MSLNTVYAMANHKKHVVVCDDQTLWIKHYLDALDARGYELHYFQNTSDCLNNVKSGRLNNVHMFILDVVFEHPFFHYPPEDCRYGEIAGLKLAHEVRHRFSDVPIILFSGADFQHIVDLAETAVAGLRTENLGNSAYIKKGDYRPNEMAAFVARFFNCGRFPSNVLTRWLNKMGIEIPLIGGANLTLSRT